jgi:hypothetical protein
LTDEKPKNKKTMSLLLKLTIALLIVVTLLAGVRLTLKSDWLLSYVRELAVEQANSQLNGELAIDRIQGDLLFGFTVYGVYLRDDENRQIAAIDSASVQYTIPSLITQPYRLDMLSVSGFDGNFVQGKDSVWNVQRILPQSDTTDTEPSDPLYWEVNRILLERSNLMVESDLLLPDGFLELENVNLQAAAEVFPDRWYASVDELDLRIREGRFPSPIDVSMQAVAMDEQVTLESLIINTGRTLLESNAQLLNRQTLAGNVAVTPLSAKDIEAYLDEYPLQRDLNIGISFQGDFENFETSITLDAGPGGTVAMRSQTDISDPYRLKELNIELNEFSGRELLGDSTLPNLDYARLNGTGGVNLMEPETAEWQGSLELSNISMASYSLDEANFDYSLNDGVADLSGELRKETESIRLSANASGVFSDLPEWNGEFSTKNMNLATWFNDPVLESDLSFTLSADGSGMQQSDLQSQINLVVEEGRFGEQPISEITFNGQVSSNEISGQWSGRINESVARANATINNWAGNPTYVFDLTLDELNLADITGLESLPTYINGRLQGEGRSFDIENLALTATANFDTTIINGQPIDTLRSDIRVENEVLYVENSVLKSPIADAQLSLRQHITDYTNLENRLNFSAELKDLYPFAPLLGVEQLLMRGGLEGRLARNGSRELEFNGNLSLEEVQVDTVFSSEEIIGSITVLLLDEPQIKSNLEMVGPVVYGQGIQDFTTSGTALITENDTYGSIGFQLLNAEEGRITHAGQYNYNSDRFQLVTDTLEFETPSRMLSLRESFNILYQDGSLSVDSLRVQTEDEYAFLELWAPHIDSLSQNAGLNAQNLNIGVLQRTLMGGEMVDGFLSAYVQLNSSPDSLALTSTGLLSSIRFENGEMDSLRFSGNIKQEWLDLSLEGWHNDTELLKGSARVPFLPGDPLTFDDQFFDREIEGRFRVNQTEADYWLAFMPGELVEETSGDITFQGEMTGKAGVPEFEGELKFRNGRLSGVPVDSVSIDMLYDHEEATFGFDGTLTSRRERVLDFSSSIPFKLDLRKAEVVFPSGDDSLQVDLQTRNLNLAVVNDFVDRTMVRQIAGRINGDLVVSGTLDNLQPDGSLELTNGSMRVIPAGIRLENIGGELAFSPNEVAIRQFSMSSGPGRIRGSGTIEIENLQPGNIDISIRGSQFQAANTQDYNAIIDLNSNFSGTIEEPNLQGDLTFLNGFVFLQNFGERAVEDVSLEGEEEAESADFYENMDIDVNVEFTRDFFIRNRQYLDLEIELDGQVDLLKEPAGDLQMFGQLEGVRGYARPLGKNFELETATVTFSGQVENPELNVRTVYEPPQVRTDVRIFYIIEGTAQDPDFRFDSEPQMELQDIFSYTVFGKPFYELDSWEQAVAGSGGGTSATDVALDVLLDRVELLASQRLGIDVVQIDNSRTSSDSNTSILTGWYLNRKTFFALVNEISNNPKTLFILEYLLRENLELIITQGDDSRQGVDLRWKLDY